MGGASNSALANRGHQQQQPLQAASPPQQKLERKPQTRTSVSDGRGTNTREHSGAFEGRSTFRLFETVQRNVRTKKGKASTIGP